GRVGRRQPAAGPLLARGLLAGSDRVPEIGDRRALIDAAGIQDRVGPADRVLNLRILAEQTDAATGCLLGGELDQRVDARSSDARDRRAVVRTGPGLAR